MRIVWVSFVPLRTLEQPSLAVAPVRYRITRPARAIEGSTVTYVGPGVNRRTLLEHFAGADAAVFGRIFDASMGQTVVELASAISKQGTKVIVDCSDDYSALPELGSLYRSLIQEADALAASTTALADLLRSQTLAPVGVVGDPVEGERGAPRASSRRPPRLLWVGQPHQVPSVQSALDQLRRGRAHYALTLLTSAGAGAEDLGHRFRPWSTDGLLEELRECDAVILPSVGGFQQALWAGRFVIAHPDRSFDQMSPYGWIGDDLSEGVGWLLEHPEPAMERIRAGQEWVARHASLEAIARDWQALIERRH